uniref:Uncharacterized protein n=1 Tax=viral metagenome TaxID=1070528 RepID=A0A6M3KZZ9_9ZZZZ
MASAGPNSPSTLVSDSTIGTEVWANPTNASASDNSYATASLAINEISEYLMVTGFGFSLPSDASVTGIYAEVERKAFAGAYQPFVKDYSVRLVKGGTIQGSDYADTGIYWPASDIYKGYGGSSNLWNLTWEYTDINASDFGIVVSCKEMNVRVTTAYIDHIRITVDFSSLSVAGIDTVILERKTKGVFRGIKRGVN